MKDFDEIDLDPVNLVSGEALHLDTWQAVTGDVPTGGIVWVEKRCERCKGLGRRRFRWWDCSDCDGTGISGAIVGTFGDMEER